MEYSTKERQVFSFFDGEKTVWADPLEIHDRLTDLLDGDPQKAIVDSTAPGAKDDQGRDLPCQPDPRIRYHAKRRLYAAVREAFEMPAFDRTTGEGARMEHVVLALNAFCTWMNAHKKKAENSAIYAVPDSSVSPIPITQPS